MVFRLGLGALLSVGAVWWREGSAGFGHMASPLLWQWVPVYGAVFVAGAQICWFSGLKCARPGDVALAGVFSPLAAVLFALWCSWARCGARLSAPAAWSSRSGSHAGSSVRAAMSSCKRGEGASNPLAHGCDPAARRHHGAGLSCVLRCSERVVRVVVVRRTAAAHGIGRSHRP